MSILYFYCFVALTIAMLLPVAGKPARIFEYPQFMAAVFAVFITPQAVSLLRFPGEAPPQAVSAVLLMSVLCLAACPLGYLVRPSKRFSSYLTFPINPSRLFIGGLVFVACGYVFSFLISQLSEEETGGTAWSGVVTIYSFFAGLIYPGFAICLITALQQRNQVFPWIATLVAAFLPIEITVLGGRREPTTQFILTILLTLYYRRRWVPPRLAILGAIVFAAVAIPATGTYRTIAALGAWSYLPQINLLENFNDYVNSESILELRNGAMVIEATRQDHSYQWGTSYWDQMVFRFVPAQIVGPTVKQALMFHTAEERDAQEELDEHYAFQAIRGITVTGMGDAFRQFGYFGCLFFGLVAVVFRNLYDATLKPGATFAQLLYMSIVTSSIHAVTHQTVDVLPGITYNFVFLGLVAFFANDRVRSLRRKAGGPARVPTRAQTTR